MNERAPARSRCALRVKLRPLRAASSEKLTNRKSSGTQRITLRGALDSKAELPRPQGEEPSRTLRRGEREGSSWLLVRAGLTQTQGSPSAVYIHCTAAAFATPKAVSGKTPSPRTNTAAIKSTAATYPERMGTAKGAPGFGSRMYMYTMTFR